MKHNWSEIFYYDETSESCLRWKVDVFTLKHRRRKLKSAGDIAGSKHFRAKTNKPKDWQVSYQGKLYPVHRIIWSLFHDIDEEFVIDHIDRNPFNNVISNLRSVSTTVNNRNMPKSPRNKTGVTGVVEIQYKGHHCFRVFWRENKKQKSRSFNCSHLGYHLAFELACEFRKQKIAELNFKGANYHESHGK